MQQFPPPPTPQIFLYYLCLRLAIKQLIYKYSKSQMNLDSSEAKALQRLGKQTQKSNTQLPPPKKQQPMADFWGCYKCDPHIKQSEQGVSMCFIRLIKQSSDGAYARGTHLQQQDPPRARLPGRSPKAGEQQTKTSAIDSLSLSASSLKAKCASSQERHCRAPNRSNSETCIKGKTGENTLQFPQFPCSIVPLESDLDDPFNQSFYFSYPCHLQERHG